MPRQSITKMCARCRQILPREAFAEKPRADSPTMRLDALCRACRAIRDEERKPLPPNTSVLCACGCGKPTNRAPATDPSKGWVRGEPMKYLKGHNTRHSPYPDSLYTIDPETGCWNWNLSRDEDGYGRLHRGGKRLIAHRFFYEQRFGPLPDGMVPDHLCRNTSCVNPDHMRALPLGENSRWKSSTKLDWEKVAGIRLLALQGVTQGEIARRYGIAQSHVHHIVTGKKWAA